MKSIIPCIIAALFATASFAQNQHVRQRREYTPKELATWHTNIMHQHLQLDSIQYRAIYLMNYADAVATQEKIKAYKEEREKMQAEGKSIKQPTARQKRAYIKAKKKHERKRNRQIKRILSPEQYDKYLKIKIQ